MNDQELKEYIAKVVFEYSNVVYTSLCEVMQAILNKEPNINTSDIWNKNVELANKRQIDGDK